MSEGSIISKPSILAMESDLRDLEALLGASMNLFAERMSPGHDLDEQTADQIWTLVRYSHGLTEKLQAVWDALVEAQQGAKAKAA